LSERGNCVALKTQQVPNGDGNLIALLGPTFPSSNQAPILVEWQATTTVSFGQNYSVLLPTDPSAWSMNAPPNNILCLVQSYDKLYLRIDGSTQPGRYFPCFIELATGALIERHLPGILAYALEWEFVATPVEGTGRSILKYPY